MHGYNSPHLHPRLVMLYSSSPAKLLRVNPEVIRLRLPAAALEQVRLVRQGHAMRAPAAHISTAVCAHVVITR